MTPPDPASALEAISLQACQAADACEPQLIAARDELARCEAGRRLPPETCARVEAQAAQLHRISTQLHQAHQHAARMEDELTARLQDVRKSVTRRWYRLNPPSNTLIDHAEERSAHFAQGMNLYKVCLILFLGSFAGVIIELAWCLVTNGYLESRAGLVWGPFNMLYGVGAAALSLALYRYRNRGRWLSFLGGMVVGSAVEYACSLFQEAAYGSASWDYSHLPFNLNGRICLMYSVFWGLLGVMWIKDIYPRMSGWILKIPNRAGKIITWVLVVFLVCNCAVSSLAVSRWAQRRQGVPAATRMEAILDDRFPDERMEHIYANMQFE